MKPQQTITPASKRTPPTAEQIRAEQNRQAERDRAAAEAKLPAKPVNAAIAVPDIRTEKDKYLDEIAPASIVGRMVKFNGKDGIFKTVDDDEAIGDDVKFTALCDQTLVGRIKFNGNNEPPDRVMGLLYDGFVMPPRGALGDDDPTQWEIGLDGKPSDPWQHHIYLVLQRSDTDELFTFVAGNKTGRRAVGNLLRHYDRLQKTNPDAYPVVWLKVGGYQDPRPEIGWVNTPVFAVAGRVQKANAAKPGATDPSDPIPF